MVLLKALILGVVQGLTEFLPISSSGHLVLFQTLFGMKEPMIAFDIALHAGTLLAVLIYFRKEVLSILSDFWIFVSRCFCPCACAASSKTGNGGNLWFPIALTLLPTGVIAVLFKDFFESAFSNLMFVSIAWLVTGILLVLSAKFREGTRQLSGIGWVMALGIGLVQGIAIMPGVSRSGSTILAGMFFGIKTEDAARFSFLISVPAILAAIAMKMKEGMAYFFSHENEVLIGFAAAAISGYLVIKWLMSVIHKGKFFRFGYYCIFIGVLSLILSCCAS